MAVYVYSLAKDGGTPLSENFKVSEFACRDGTDEILIDSDLVDTLQKLRDRFKKPVTVTSGYRTPEHNAAVGGATGSYHVKGRAADIVISGITPIETAKYAEHKGVQGIGLYDYASGGFVHVDTRPDKYFWTQKSASASCAGTETFLDGSEDFEDGEITGEDDGVTQAETAAGGSWAEEDVAWAVENGIITGDGTGLALSRGCTRREAAVMLHRFWKLVKGGAD